MSAALSADDYCAGVIAGDRRLVAKDAAFVSDPDARAALVRAIAGLDATVIVAAPAGEKPIVATRIWQLGARPCAGAA